MDWHLAVMGLVLHNEFSWETSWKLNMVLNDY